ncbi:helix-turn-helix domain-containing protein [Xanthomonas hortorum pv. vitians]|uniref:helix-turn-helix domain-containing protein n=1 Tax=Xanthomonas hortorum TaxID=56454 RepID=UPI001459CA6B|nr:XRE family transcriptional regulator [Xanthomonas hortorum]MCE4282560.1 helix-turn-helix domain-containing protein [Xanthomonas hortorum pv. vitians]MCE4287413.1 helix-turn-helix domain-containing protein [Xanthomonas hortorum pv. vitians]MCE4291839.1 helix-turn-helix domain-containing protein [Xanthomonas hortorum pv. vitians]MCE4296138.1 helix-turn-helix domain-containing protein [Xanthomonas hortorum pv. vitians]MDT7854881.1 XRE family transcriptional regulator [Xanthomonas hortorum pv. 
MLKKSIVSVPEQGDIEIHHGSDNVYADLEFSDAEAMQAKAQLIAQLRRVIQSRQWSPEQAAAQIELPAAELAQVTRGHFRAYQVNDVAGWLNKARDTEK